MTTKTGQALHARPFASKVTLIPHFVNGEFTGKPYKAELVLFRSSDAGARLHVWFAADPRPHNHPWEHITCKVLHGSYTAVEYFDTAKPDEFNVHEVTLNADSDEHSLNHDSFHQVVKVEPGTISVMSFGATVGDGKQWGNLIVGEGKYKYEPNSLQPGFLDALRHLNPHMRPADWVDPYAHLPAVDVNELMAETGL